MHLSIPEYCIAIALVLGAAIWWLSSGSLAGSVARTADTERALAEAAQKVADTVATFNLGPCEVSPVWAHGCPCVRVSMVGAERHEASALVRQARKAAASALEQAVRESPAFSHIASRYSGEQGLLWL